MNVPATSLTWATIGDPTNHLWLSLLLSRGDGVAVFGDGANPGGGSTVVQVNVAEPASGPSAGRTLTGPGLELELTEQGSCTTAISGGEIEHGLVMAAGKLDLGDRVVPLDGRGILAGGVDPGFAGLDSARLACAWFDEGSSYSLAALRPRKAKGQDHDRLHAARLGDEGCEAFADPRLSTTYGPDDAVIRAGLELWLEAEEDEEDSFPHRVAGEALAGPVELATAGLRAAVTPFEWHSRGRGGFGTYALLRTA